MTQTFLYRLIFIVFFIFFGATAHAKSGNVKVVLVSVASENDKYWHEIHNLAKAAAKDLHIDFEILLSESNHLEVIRISKELTQRETKPDYVILVAEKTAASKAIPILNKSGIKVFVFGDMTKEEQKLIGTPRQKYANYIGQLVPDDYLAGYLTAESMIENLIKNKRFDQNGNINILAFEGVRHTQFNLERVRGLKDVLKQYPQVKLLQSIPTDWTYNYVFNALPALLKRYDGINIVGVWCVGAQSARASADIITSQRLDILTVGTNWSPLAAQRVNQGDILSLAGGHVASVAWILVLLYDYHNDKDFGSSVFRSEVTLMDKDFSGKYLSYIKNNDWSHIDFTRYSKVKNPKIMAYDFSLNDIINHLEKH